MARSTKKRILTREAWSYAILLVVLFAIAAVAARRTILYLEAVAPSESTVVAVVIATLSLGFMSIAGAFGLWAINLSAGAESRRRIGRIVDDMDYLSDGLLAVDAKGGIRGANPSVHRLAGRAAAEPLHSIHELFPCLTDTDMARLIPASEPVEVERESPMPGRADHRVLRFRAQPADGLSLLLISDVTAEDARRQRGRQMARVQLIGELSRGVAHDFNTLLCSISGHASLLPRLTPHSREMQHSLDAIARHAERGVALAAHLIDLARPAPAAAPVPLAVQVQNAVRTLRDTLPEGWRFESTVEDVSETTGTSIPVEQILVNLGLAAADTLGETGTIRIRHLLQPPVPEPTRARPSTVLQLEAIHFPAGAPTPALAPDTRESGVILSVIRSMIEEAGGSMERLSSVGGAPVFRVRVPQAGLDLFSAKRGAAVSLDLGAYIRDWEVILAVPRGTQAITERMLLTSGARADRVDGIGSALSRLDTAAELHCLIIDERWLGDEPRGLIKAIQKLRPGLGIVVLCRDPLERGAEWKADIALVNSADSPEAILRAVIDARTLASRRARA